MASFLFLDLEKNQEKMKLRFEYFWNIMENGAFALLEQMLHFP